MRRPAQILHFITVVDVRRARGDERVASAIKKNCMSTQFGMSDENEMTRGLSSSHSQQLFSAIILLWSGVGGQLLSSCCCGQGLAVSYDSSCCCGQGLVVSYYSSSCCGHWLVVSYYSSCCCGQGLVASYLIIILLWSGVGGQLFDHCLTVVRNWWPTCCGQELVVNCAHVLWKDPFATLGGNFKIENNKQNNHNPNKNNEN